MAYDNTNSGILSRNERKTQPKHPDFSGQINIEGVDYWLSGWTKEGKAGKLAGKKFFSLSVKRKEQQSEPKTEPKPDTTSPGPDEDVPF